jgi:hypothetical protein
MSYPKLEKTPPTAEELERMYPDESLNKKHLRLRGSLKLKYPPREARCRSTCAGVDYLVMSGPNKTQLAGHPCFLAIDHAGPCEFSSECAPSKP